MRRGALVLAAAAAVIAACSAFGAGDSSVVTSGADASIDGGLESGTPGCGWTPFTDGFENGNKWDLDTAEYGPQGNLKVAISNARPRSGTSSLSVEISPDTEARAYSFEHAPRGTGSGCIEVALWLRVDKKPAGTGGVAAPDVPFLVFELDDSAVFVTLGSTGDINVSEEGPPAGDAGKPFAKAESALPLSALGEWNEIRVRYEKLGTPETMTVTVNGATKPYALKFAHPGDPLPRIGCRFAAPDVTASYAIDDVTIR